MSNNMRRGKQQLISDLEFLFKFSWDDFKARYAGSVGGVVWAFAQPMTTILLYWFVFQTVFGNDAVNGIPFILWLISGLIPWFFVSDAIATSVTSLAEYSYLIKKIKFSVRIIPLVKPLAVMYVQVFLLLFLIFSFCIHGYFPDIYYLQLPIYIVYMMVVAVGFSFAFSTLFVFFKDISQLVSIFMQVVFWTTPIVWSVDTITIPLIRKFITLTPFYYIVSGYRNIFVDKCWFWEAGRMTLYYWSLAIIILVSGISLYKKCKKHFADIL